jgi:hypothetical protein
MGVLFLELNRAPFDAGEEAVTRSVLALAAGTLDDTGLLDFCGGECPAGRTLNVGTGACFEADSRGDPAKGVCVPT